MDEEPRGDAAARGGPHRVAPPGEQPEVARLREQYSLAPAASVEDAGTSPTREAGRMSYDPTVTRLLEGEGAEESPTVRDLARGRQEDRPVQTSTEYATAALLPSISVNTASRLPAPTSMIPGYGRAAVLILGVARQESMMMRWAAIADGGNSMQHSVTHPAPHSAAVGAHAIGAAEERGRLEGVGDGRNAGDEQDGSPACNPSGSLPGKQRRGTPGGAWARVTGGARPRRTLTRGRHRVRHRGPAAPCPNPPAAPWTLP